MEFTILIVLIVIVCILLSLIVLIQKPKGGGLSAQFGGVGNQIFGVSRATDFVEKATWGLAAALMVLCLLSAGFLDKNVARNTESADGAKNAAPAATTSELSDMEKENKKNGTTTNLPGIPPMKP
jgi:preprotein translocase subunit SecG